MKIKEGILRKILYWYLLISPVVDMLTSLAVRAGMTALTMGVLVRVGFVGAVFFYVMFLYEGKHKTMLRVAMLVTSVYGILYLLNTVSVNGTGVLIENAKMFVKVYYFVYVLLGLYAIYEQHGILVSDKMLTVVFGVYTTSIFLAAVTNTSFSTYELLNIGYCGWFYAGNEIGAIVAILSGVALMYGFTHPKFLWIAVVGLLAFSSTYIGTKVPFLAIVVIAIVLLLVWLVKFLSRKEKRAMPQMAKCAALLLCILVLYQAGSPIQQNTMVVGDNYQDVLEEIEPDDPNDPEDGEEAEDNQFFVFANWLLSGRLYNVQNVFERYGNGSWTEKLFGIGYTFMIDGKWKSNVVEMDFISIFLKHGIVGFCVFVAPLIYFAVLCAIKLFKQLKLFWELEPAFVYLYATIIGLGCAFLAGHVLVAPAVSIYIAICTVKAYAYLTNRDIAEGNEEQWIKKRLV